MKLLLIFAVIIARVCEAYRDAEAFERSIQDRSFVWHVLKFPQYGAWLIAGQFLVALALSGENANLYLVLAVGIAWPIFLVSLWGFRKMYR